MGWLKKPTPPPPPRSLLSERSTFEGEWDGAVALEIHGRLKGAVRCRQEVAVARGARLEGEARGQVFTHAGFFRGKVEAERAVFLQGADFDGSLRCKALCVERGARLKGHLEEARR